MGIGYLQQSAGSRRHKTPDDDLSEQYSHRLEGRVVGDERRPVYVAGPFEVDLVAAEDAAFRLVCDVYEALRMDEGSPGSLGWTYELQRGPRQT
ncbi:hypothetical protein ABTX77_32080 [Streptomyces sp. NPDC097704]|uniref:hypothetical protein n=1 Tax=Streptomyces sp. NPDC097704 TaxID=3157101 RepID=UPI0033302FD4